MAFDTRQTRIKIEEDQGQKRVRDIQTWLAPRDVSINLVRILSVRAVQPRISWKQMPRGVEIFDDH